MIDKEELAICRQRGHDALYGRGSDWWSLCKHCHAWVREVTKIEERTDTPPANERDSSRDNPAPFNAAEAATCARRGHYTAGLGDKGGWTLCKWCGTWLREINTIEEREDEPPKDEQHPLERLPGRKRT